MTVSATRRYTVTMAALYDPLHALRIEFHALPSITEDGISLRFEGGVAADHQEKAKIVAKSYGWVLRLQLTSGGASVQELMAQGKLKLDHGRYVPGE